LRPSESGAAASSMVRIVCRHRPHTDPAPQDDATCLVERAPSSIAFWTVLLLTPRQRQMYMVVVVLAMTVSVPGSRRRGHLEGLYQTAHEQRRMGAHPGLRHKPRHRGRVADPLLRLPFAGDLLQDHRLGLVV
jgi:hypothetical protein